MDGYEEHEIAKKPLRILILLYEKSRTHMSREGGKAGLMLPVAEEVGG